MKQEIVQQKSVVLDAKDRLMGRFASQVAKRLLNGEKVSVVNAEYLFMSGHPKSIILDYKQKLALKDKANPEHSPYHSRRADLFVKRVIRGMLPFKKPRGKSAYKNLRVYIGTPEELKISKAEKIETKSPRQVFEDTIYIKDLVEKLGYNKG
ncbi:MAG: 50S ribosomal protein L13 [Candidatus Micrarchaeota archaeon]|nr:50S ribosomal protein L13 [Candidatus Micrarchaeota archaeon]MDE1804368.1 50S ribosomal protein L13 [Candidatus Micrarchaeota archaeon]MDE1846612.1 50S ribosomal protein L13 [Candidatus Micrarchaeota archaeon]